ncbi:uncharacterized protein LOC112499677 [Cynara cardunculus var. scolymus]|uniref:Late embryogenesis abundant protein LEA-2 subgroup domain-containing protein n=1 Tax=Cynara cardunculus var. scolymus TaxID=59895 RepID=A0A103XJF0_CYNCS|nr:uncharacterized protein LOC112499677 [Cynara cardunculus var. scolymus]KVH91830.1 hypothetical protein Ccrd_006175 [Cynara cardunculus var. scolymus]
MGEGRKKPPAPPSGRTNLASCIVATVFLIFIAIIILIIFFTLFKPKNPNIAVTAVQLPSFSVTNTTVSFTISQYVAVNNPNRGVFTHYDSSLKLLYCGDQVGFMFVPSGKIEGRRTEYMAATFAVESFPVSSVINRPAEGLQVGPSLEIETRMEMAGRVRLLHFFTHHVEVNADCKVAVAIDDGSVLGFHC